MMREMKSSGTSRVGKSLTSLIKNNDLWFDVETIDKLPRRELQKLCTKFGIRAVNKTTKLIEDLKKISPGKFSKSFITTPLSIHSCLGVFSVWKS